jgi:hypothetical protein
VCVSDVFGADGGRAERCAREGGGMGSGGITGAGGWVLRAARPLRVVRVGVGGGSGVDTAFSQTTTASRSLVMWPDTTSQTPQAPSHGADAPCPTPPHPPHLHSSYPPRRHARSGQDTGHSEVHRAGLARCSPGRAATRKQISHKPLCLVSDRLRADPSSRQQH